MLETESAAEDEEDLVSILIITDLNSNSSTCNQVFYELGFNSIIFSLTSCSLTTTGQCHCTAQDIRSPGKDIDS